jgi:hypothetical protein
MFLSRGSQSLGFWDVDWCNVNCGYIHGLYVVHNVVHSVV